MINLFKIDSFEQLAEEVKTFISNDNLNKTIGLSGGTTIPPLIKALGQNIFLSDKNHWTWIDERLVPYSDKDSNYGSMKAYLFEKSCFPLPCEDNEEQKKVYQKKLSVNQGLPQLDLLLLGFGNDGHIASLFPNSKELNKICLPENWLFRSKAPYEPLERWTWGMDALTRSKQTFIIFKGDNDSEKFKQFHQANNDKKCDTPLAAFMKKSQNNIKAFQILK